MIHYIYDHGSITKRFDIVPAGTLHTDIIIENPDGSLHLYFFEPMDKAARKMFVEHFRLHYKAAKHTPIFWVKEDK